MGHVRSLVNVLLQVSYNGVSGRIFKIGQYLVKITPPPVLLVWRHWIGACATVPDP